MIAGNHDSGSRIELPAALMRRLRTHAPGRVHWLDEGQLDAERLLIPLTNGAARSPHGAGPALPAPGRGDRPATG